jgi:hypothetical protein
MLNTWASRLVMHGIRVSDIIALHFKKLKGNTELCCVPAADK